LGKSFIRRSTGDLYGQEDRLHLNIDYVSKKNNQLSHFPFTSRVDQNMGPGPAVVKIA
jgi:hypothetical protein